MRFSISTLLLLVLLVAAYFPISVLFEPWQRTRIASKHPRYAHITKFFKLREGDSYEDALSVFPSLSFVAPNADDRIYFEKLDKLVTGKELPKDVELYHYNSHGVVGTLTFRDGKLARKTIVDDNPAIAAQKRLITPSLWFRSGILPIYTVIASFIFAAWTLAGSRHRSQSGSATISQLKESATDT